jgi:hypothetical protein
MRERYLYRRIPGEHSMHNNIMEARVLLVEKVMRNITLCPQMVI